jgi:hypothetical protein
MNGQRPLGNPSFTLPPIMLGPHHPLCAANQRPGGQRWVTGSGRTRAIACGPALKMVGRQPGQPPKARSADKVLSPITGRAILVNGQAFQKVLELGYIFREGQFFHKNCVDASTGEPFATIGARPQEQDTGKQPQRSGGATVARSAGAHPSSRVFRYLLWSWR